MRFSALVQMLQTNDMQQTKEWYVSVLGFAVSGEMGAEWCELRRDDVAIMFMSNEHLGTPQATATQYFRVDDVTALWSGIKDRCKAEWGPEEMPYGMLEFAIRDPNGYLLSFGQEIQPAEQGSGLEMRGDRRCLRFPWRMPGVICSFILCLDEDSGLH